jgi:hypothetical protein
MVYATSSTPLTAAAARAIALPASTDSLYQSTWQVRERLQRLCSQADDLAVGYRDLSLAADGSNAWELASILKARLAVVRAVLKRARYNEARRAMGYS